MTALIHLALAGENARLRERLKVLSDFVKTAPGRLPDRVQNALDDESGQ